MKRFPHLFLFLCISVGGAMGFPFQVSYAATSATDLQNQIDDHQRQIAALEAEITADQKELDAIGAKKNTLQSTVASLTLSQKQLASKIQVTQNKIDSANLQIQQLSLSIGDKEANVARDENVIASQLQHMAETDAIPIAALLLSSHSAGEAWQTVDQAAQFNQALESNVAALRQSRTVLATNRDQVTAAKADLLDLQNNLNLQKRSVDASKATQQQLLADTKNQESNYQALIAKKRASEQAFESELNDLQSQLDLIVHPGNLPKVGSGVLSWPFASSFMQSCATRTGVFGNRYCITQYFGTTPFSTANPQVYNGSGHNGIDIAAPIGTPVEAALSGTVLATGNTDLVRDANGRQCYSFGKWVMLEHHNGINTMYAHLSEIDISKGQSIKTGQVIGLSGMTGYATGPHLHFGVYATEGTEIMTLRQFRGATIGCADAEMPVATLDAYLNPLSYL